ncbi:MAG: hypothetical protein ACI91O_001409 [Candidatus Poriferisodalaceae bacterium]
MSYRVPREPSTPRIAIWRKLRDLGVVQIGDGLVALPNDARTREHFEWIAAKAIDADGEAIVWVATPAAKRNSASLADQMREARTAEYRELLDDIEARQDSHDERNIARWRRTWRRIERRDYFRPPLRDEARLAIAALAQTPASPKEVTA